jgi:hypothetical protein
MLAAAPPAGGWGMGTLGPSDHVEVAIDQHVGVSHERRPARGAMAPVAGGTTGGVTGDMTGALPGALPGA